MLQFLLLFFQDFILLILSINPLLDRFRDRLTVSSFNNHMSHFILAYFSFHLNKIN